MSKRKKSTSRTICVSVSYTWRVFWTHLITLQHIERNEKALRHKTTHQQDQAGQGSHQSPQPSLFPYKGKSKEKENDLVMKNGCRIN